MSCVGARCVGWMRWRAPQSTPVYILPIIPQLNPGVRRHRTGEGAEQRHRSVLSKPLDAFKKSGLGWKEGQMQGAKAARADKAGQSSLEEGQRHFDLILPSNSGDAGGQRRMAVTGAQGRPTSGPSPRRRRTSLDRSPVSKIQIVRNLIRAAPTPSKHYIIGDKMRSVLRRD